MINEIDNNYLIEKMNEHLNVVDFGITQLMIRTLEGELLNVYELKDNERECIFDKEYLTVINGDTSNTYKVCNDTLLVIGDYFSVECIDSILGRLVFQFYM